MGNWWWAWFAVAVGLNLGAGVWNVLAARCHLRAAAAWRTGEPPVGAAGADEAARKEIADWLAGVYMKMRERDQAVLAELEARTKATFKEGLELVDLSSNHAHIAIVRSYDAATHTCMVEVPWRTGLIEADIDYPQKYAPMILKAGMKVYVRFFPAIEGYVVPD